MKEIALSKRKAIKKNIKDNYGRERADRFSAHVIIILGIFNEKEDFMRQMFGIVTTSQKTIDY